MSVSLRCTLTFANSNGFIRVIAACYLSFRNVACFVMFLVPGTGVVVNISVTLKGSFGGRKALNTTHFIGQSKVPGWVTKRLPCFVYVDLQLYFGPEIGNMYDAYSVSYNSTMKDKKRKNLIVFIFGCYIFTSVSNKCATKALLHTERHAMAKLDVCLSKERERWRQKLKAVSSLTISFYLKTRWLSKEGKN